MGALSYLGGVTASTRTIASEVNNHLNKIGKPLPVYPDMKSQVIWGKDSNPKNTEHYTGRALDFMILGSVSVGDAVADYLWANRSRLGLIHIIWKQRIKSTQTNPGVWRKMSDRGSPTENHMDHVHAYFNGKAVSGSPSTPPASSSSSGSGSSAYFQPKGVTMTVKQVQKAAGVKADGYYGADTKAAVKKLQKRLGVTADGLWGPNTEKAYKGSSSTPARKPSTAAKLAVDGIEGPATVKALQRFLGVTADGKRGPATNRALQKWVGTKQDGIVGPATTKALQRKVGSTADGKWGKNTTKALQRFLNKA